MEMGSIGSLIAGSSYSSSKDDVESKMWTVFVPEGLNDGSDSTELAEAPAVYLHRVPSGQKPGHLSAFSTP